jgi:hypothetical protein
MQRTARVIDVFDDAFLKPVAGQIWARPTAGRQTNHRRPVEKGLSIPSLNAHPVPRQLYPRRRRLHVDDKVLYRGLLADLYRVMKDTETVPFKSFTVECWRNRPILNPLLGPQRSSRGMSHATPSWPARPTPLSSMAFLDG